MIPSLISEIIPFASALIVAIIAGGYAVSQIRKNHILTSRIKWLNNLKNLVSEYTVAIEKTYQSGHQYNKIQTLMTEDKKEHATSFVLEKGIEFLAKALSEYEENKYTAILKIRLIIVNLNPEETLHKLLEEHLLAYSVTWKENTKSADAVINEDVISTRLQNILEISRSIFKLEWEQIKQSDDDYKYYKEHGKGKEIIEKTAKAFPKPISA